MNVIFKSLLIADIEEKTARKITLYEGFNIFTSSENSVGKSSLLKSLYYTLGAEVFFDNYWKKDSKLCSLEFYFEGKDYTMNRLKNKYCIFKDNTLMFQGNETKNIRSVLELIFNFTIYIRDKTKHVTRAFPVLTYLPYYIDQDHGWGDAPYLSFITRQYDKNQILNSLYYHLGLQEDNISDAVNNLRSNQDKLKELEGTVDNEKNVLQILLSKSGQIVEGISVAELERNLNFSKEKIESIVEKIKDSRSHIQKLHSELIQHETQLKIVVDYSKIKSNLLPDKNISQIVLCPNCGYNVSSDLYDIVRKSYSIQNENYLHQQIKSIIDSVKRELKAEDENYLKLQVMLRDEEEIRLESEEPYSLYVKQRGLSKTIEELQNSIGTREKDIQDLKKENKRLDNLIKNSKKRKEIDHAYSVNLKLFFDNLDIPSNMIEKSQLMKPIPGQGVLATKMILAQYLSVFKTMEIFGTNVPRFPFVVDSPKTKEAVGMSVNLIFEQLSELKIPSQIIISTVDFDKSLLKTEVSNIHTTVLTDKGQLLNNKQYTENEDEITDYLAMMNNIDII